MLYYGKKSKNFGNGIMWDDTGSGFGNVEFYRRRDFCIPFHTDLDGVCICDSGDSRKEECSIV